jgi:membrane protein required for colicin V production
MAPTHSLTGFDIFTLLLVGILGVRCMMRGFIKEVFTLAGLVASIILARMFSLPVGQMLFPSLKNAMAASAAGFVVVCFVVNLAATLASYLLAHVVQKIKLGPVDRIAGFCVGALQGMLVSGMLVLFAAGIAGKLESSFLKTSLFAPSLLKFMTFISGSILK